MPVRRHHSKSRYGCTQCKSRKLKCDEVKPKCGNCSKKNLDCSLETEEGSSIIFLPGLKHRSKSPNTQSQRLSPSARLSPGSAGSSTSPADARSRTLSFDQGTSSITRASSGGRESGNDSLYPGLGSEGSGLWTHFQTSTWRTLPGEQNEENRASLWLGHVNQLAQTHDFVHHGVLAVTALHLALTDPDRASSHQALALHHQTTAIRSAQPYMQSLQPTMATMVPSLFVLSILMATYDFGRPKLPAHNLHPVQDACNILRLLRGPSTIAQNSREAIEDGPLTGLGLPVLQNMERSLPSDLEASLRALDDLNKEVTLDTEMQKHYQAAIGSLWFTFMLLEEKPAFQLSVLPFAVGLPVEVLEQINGEQPLALLLLGHYAVVLHYLNEHVWQSGWGRWIVEAVSQRLDADWRRYIEWPRREVLGATYGA